MVRGQDSRRPLDAAELPGVSKTVSNVVYLGFLNIHILCAGWRLAISAGGGLSSACQFQSNPRKLTRGKLLMKQHIFNSSHLK